MSQYDYRERERERPGGEEEFGRGGGYGRGEYDDRGREQGYGRRPFETENRPYGGGERGLEAGGYGERAGYGAGTSELGGERESTARGRGRYAGRGPRGYQRSHERIREDVCERLTDHPDVDASEIEVEVDNGIVTLRGSVEERAQKRMAEDVAERVGGVRDVRNQLEVDQGLFEQLKDALTGDDDAEKEPTRSRRSRTTRTSSRK